MTNQNLQTASSQAHLLTTKLENAFIFSWSVHLYGKGHQGLWAFGMPHLLTKQTESWLQKEGEKECLFSSHGGHGGANIRIKVFL